MKKWLIFLLFSPIVMAYQLGDGSKRLFSEQEIADATFRQLRLMKNDIFALHGYRFNDKDLHTYYDRQIWYRPAADNAAIVLTETEQKNVAALQKRIVQVEKNRRLIVEQLITVKDLNQAAMEAHFKMKFDADVWTDFQRLVQQINYVALERTGFSRITQDDGELALYYQATAEGDGLTLSFHRGVSQLEPVLKLEPDEEWSIFWHFKLINDKLTFVKADVAG